jgi:hypothetical protein
MFGDEKSVAAATAANVPWSCPGIRLSDMYGTSEDIEAVLAGHLRRQCVTYLKCDDCLQWVACKEVPLAAKFLFVLLSSSEFLGRGGGRGGGGLCRGGGAGGAGGAGGGGHGVVTAIIDDEWRTCQAGPYVIGKSRRLLVAHFPAWHISAESTRTRYHQSMAFWTGPLGHGCRSQAVDATAASSSASRTGIVVVLVVAWATPAR